ncbi:hypothetical protein [Streptomyces sp. NPDC097619]|uniref:hypothetical protein n=1 Tax=Streptomyces sp. NPDC097619 TaxID=3157228 RepID=UPI003325C936
MSALPTGARPGLLGTLAHGVGSQHDLPISPFYAFAGAFTALFVSFLALGLLWSTSRFRGDRSGVPLPGALQRLADAPPFRAALRVLGAAAVLFLFVHLLFGPSDPERNAAPGAVYVLLWVGLVPASLLFGPVWRLVSPLRALHFLLSRTVTWARTAAPPQCDPGAAPHAPDPAVPDPVSSSPLPHSSHRPAGRNRAGDPETPPKDPRGSLTEHQGGPPTHASTGAPAHAPAPTAAPAPAAVAATPTATHPKRTPAFASPRPLPARIGLWPAAVGLLAFTWLELVAPEPAARTTLLCALAVHLLGQLALAARYGEAWFAHGDPFEAYSTLLARLAPLGRRADGRLVLRNPLHGLDATPEQPGLVATLCVLLGSTAYDGISDHPDWIDTLQTSPLGRTATATLGLLAITLLVGALYGLCAGATRLLSGATARPATAFAHSLLPIALGYLTAHYFSLLTTEGPRTLALLAGSADATAPESPLGPGGLAVLQVTAVITGHVLGVVAAHDRSVRLFPPVRAVAGQLPLLILMIIYTVGGLGLLLN